MGRTAQQVHADTLAQAIALATQIISDLGGLDSREADWGDMGNMGNVVELLSRVAAHTTQDARVRAEWNHGDEGRALEMVIRLAEKAGRIS